MPIAQHKMLVFNGELVLLSARSTRQMPMSSA